MREEERRPRVVAAVTGQDGHGPCWRAGQRLSRFAVDEMVLSGCALVLMPEAESASVLAGTGRHAQTVTGLAMELGEGRACSRTQREAQVSRSCWGQAAWTGS